MWLCGYLNFHFTAIAAKLEGRGFSKSFGESSYVETPGTPKVPQILDVNLHVLTLIIIEST